MGALRRAFGEQAARVELPEKRWSRDGKSYGAAFVLRRLWHDVGLEAAMLRAARGEREAAETAFRSVACAVLEPEAMGQAHRWIWGVAWPGGTRASSREVRTSLKLLGVAKHFLEDALFLAGRDLFTLGIRHGILVATDTVMVLFREQARPVAFEWVDGDPSTAAERLLRRFAPQSTTLLQDTGLVTGVREVFSAALSQGTERVRQGTAVAAFLALVLLAELRRRLPDTLGTSEVLRNLVDLRALEVTLGPRRYLVRQRLAGPARHAFRALGLGVPRRVIALAQETA
jgi:hypothetical protein